MKLFVILSLITNAALYGQLSDFEHIDFKKADSTAAFYKGASIENLPLLTHNLTADLSTDVEKFRAIYTWVCKNIENDYSSYQRTIKKRKKLITDSTALAEWNVEAAQKVFKNLLKYKKTACTGYAFLLRELARLATIECKIINGYGRTPTLILNENSIPNHSWNAVELNGKWYLCDSTWSAGRIMLEETGPKFEADYFDGYFLADPALFIENHYPLDTEWALLSTPPTFTQFIEGPVVYKEAFTQKVIPTTPETMRIQTVKNKNVLFILEVPDTLKNEDIYLVLSNGSSNKTVVPSVILNNNECRLEHSFDRLGSYDVHIQVADKIVATYVVRVKRG